MQIEVVKRLDKIILRLPDGQGRFLNAWSIDGHQNGEWIVDLEPKPTPVRDAGEAAFESPDA